MIFDKKISVILPIYNEPFNLIKKSIESVLIQTYTNFELIIVVDNPNIKDEVSQLLNFIKTSDDRVIVIYNKSNIGLAESLNLGLTVSTGEYIARMDADDISKKSRLEKQIMYCINNNVDLLSTNISIIDVDDRILEERKFVSLDPKKTLPYYCSLYHPTIMVKTCVLKEVGGYTDIRISEDYELYFRLMIKDVNISMLDEPLLLYRVRNNSILNTNTYKSRLATEFIINNYKKALKMGTYVFSIDNYNNYINNGNCIDAKKYDIVYRTVFKMKQSNTFLWKLLCIIDSLLQSPKWTLIIFFEVIKNRLITFFSNMVYIYENKGSGKKY